MGAAGDAWEKEWPSVTGRGSGGHASGEGKQQATGPEHPRTPGF